MIALQNTLAGAVLAGTMVFSTAAFATTTECDPNANPDVTLDVTVSTYCGLLNSDDGNVSNSIIEFNATNFGGFMDWVDLGKIDTPNVSVASTTYTSGTGNLKIVTNTVSVPEEDDEGVLKNSAYAGTWEILENPVTGIYTTFALVWKAGKNNLLIGPEVGYIVTPFTGNWETPIFGDNGDRKGLSHVSLYARGTCPTGQVVIRTNSGTVCGTAGGPPPVPLPAGLPLMLTAIGVGAYMRKRARKSA